MYNTIPNYLSHSLAKDNEFQKMSETVLKNLFDSNEKLYASKNGKKAFEAKLFSNKEQKLNYLLVKKEDNITVYEEPIYSWKNTPFDYAVKELKEGSPEIHSREILSLPLVGSDEILEMAKVIKKYLFNVVDDKLSPLERKEADAMAEKLEKDPELEKKVMSKLSLALDNELKCTSNPYKLKVFYDYLYNQGLLSESIPDEKWIDKNVVYKGPGYNRSPFQQMEQLKTDINFLFDVCDQNKFSSKKKFTFNDADNFFYGQGNGMVIESQGMGAYVTMKGEEITVYAFDKEGEGFLKYNTLPALVDSIEKGTNTVLDSVILKINKDDIEYMNVNSWYCFSTDVEYTRKNIISEGLGIMSYPIDIQSFDYQLKFTQQEYGFTKFEFLASRFMTYSSESNYDKKLGIFTNEDITYSKDIENAKIDDTEIPEKFSYCIPMKNIPYLQKEWIEGLEYMVEVLKTHSPMPSVSNSDNKVQDIKDAATHFEAMIPKLKAKLQKENKLRM
jgi:hypothetical protein